MNNQEENEIARNAARDAGIRGKNWQGDSAMKCFMRDFHNLPRYQRQDMGYWGIKSYAEQWWSENRSQFS